MRILITGGAGFVAPYLVSALRDEKAENCDILCTAQTARADSGIAQMDITDASAVEQVFKAYSPTHIAHLAGISVAATAASDPHSAWRVNVLGTLNIVAATCKYAPDAPLLFASSGQVYGESVRPGVPADETTLLQPVNDYAVTKAAADLALGAAAIADGLRSIRFRPFNHTGPGQRPVFAVPSFARQIAEIEAGKAAPVIRVGNLDVARDFLDVRDVARAYASALCRAGEIPPGTVLNVASGVPRSLRSILATLLSMSEVEIRVETESARVRRGDPAYFVGDATALRKLLGWKPRFEFDATLRDVLNYCREHKSAA